MKILFYLFSILLLTSCTALYDVEDVLVVKDSAEETLMYLEELNQKFPNDLDIAYQYAYALTSLGETELAAIVLADKEDIAILELLLHIHKTENNDSEYLKVLTTLVELDNTNIKNKEELLTYYIEQELPAEDIAKDILKYDVKNEKALAYLAKTNPFYSLFISSDTIESQSSLNSTPA